MSRPFGHGRPVPPRSLWGHLTRASSIVGLLFLVGVVAFPVGALGGSVSTPGREVLNAGTLARATAHAAPSLGFNPPCYPIASTICVASASPSQPDILPPFGSFVATTQPTATKNIDLLVKSRFPLNYTNAPKSGPNALMELNVTGTLWNGNPYYSQYSGDVWHANNNTNFWWWSGMVTQNISYPYWYDLQFSANSTTGPPNFFCGQHVTWWIAFYTYNGSTRQHWESPHFQFTYAGAWAYSPYPGSAQYAGSSAVGQDVQVTLSPSAPNWNDSVTATINSTAADGPPVNASIGRINWVVTETSPNGTVLNATTFSFPVPAVPYLGGRGASTTRATIPANWAQIPGATVAYHFVIYDTSNDALQTQTQVYVVGGNGSFSTGIFADDLGLDVTPASILTSFNASVPAGSAVPVTLLSRNPNTAILAAQISVTFTYPEIGETATTILPMQRVHSTDFVATIAPFPIGSDLTFTVEVWDFTQHEEVSPLYSYSVPTLGSLIPVIPGNATFFYVYVFDNGTHSWVSGASVRITGLSSYLNLVISTSYGIAYPNVSALPLVPEVVPANTTYRITVTDLTWRPNGHIAAPPLNVTLLLGHSLTARGPLSVGSNFMVLLEGDALMFYLNASPPATVSSPTAPGTNGDLRPILGLVATIVVAVPVLGWWRRARARRVQEERRITL